MDVSKETQQKLAAYSQDPPYAIGSAVRVLGSAATMQREMEKSGEWCPEILPLCNQIGSVLGYTSDRLNAGALVSTRPKCQHALLREASSSALNACTNCGTRSTAACPTCNTLLCGPCCVAVMTGLTIRVAGCSMTNIDGDYVIENELRNRRFCFSKAGGLGAIYFDGAFWKLCQGGQGRTESGWNFSQRSDQEEALLPPTGQNWVKTSCVQSEVARDYNGLLLELVGVPGGVSPQLIVGFGGGQLVQCPTSFVTPVEPGCYIFRCTSSEGVQCQSALPAPKRHKGFIASLMGSSVSEAPQPCGELTFGEEVLATEIVVSTHSESSDPLQYLQLAPPSKGFCELYGPRGLQMEFRRHQLRPSCSGTPRSLPCVAFSFTVKADLADWLSSFRYSVCHCRGCQRHCEQVGRSVRGHLRARIRWQIQELPRQHLVPLRGILEVEFRGLQCRLVLESKVHRRGSTIWAVEQGLGLRRSILLPQCLPAADREPPECEPG